MRVLDPSHSGFALEAKSLTEGCAEGECCGSCSCPAAPPLVSPVLTAEEQGFTTVELCQDGDICLTANEGEMEEMSGQDPNYEDMQRKDGRLPFQIFPDPVEVVLGPETTLNSLDHDHEKERLPSIVVEPTELSEVESGELRWPPENMDMEEDEEDLFLEQCIPPANIADWGEEDEEEEEEETSVILNQQSGLTLIDLQSDAFRDDTPTLPPSSAPALN
ncbi:Protein LBH [Nibea albiflora]|uniref:Protein LBH n=1 Tax=Nibea albiflora TaxID=240163 RepID=A0ACB7EJZ9_NIBAL|nr:Protein LBH [Nibea albiflora]